MGLRDKVKADLAASRDAQQDAADARAESRAAAEAQAAATAEREREAARAAGAPVRWDYKTVVMGHGFMGWHKDEVHRGKLEEQLDQLGSEGWELIHVWWHQKLQGEKDGHLMVFKRPVFA